MTKKILKELIISLLLCLAIILLLGIVLYEYVPMTKTIPNAVSYTTPENVKQELANAEDVDEEEIIMTYEVDATDLNNYKQIQNYKPGKANPFSSYESSETTEKNGTNTIQGNATTSEGETNSNNSGLITEDQSNASDSNVVKEDNSTTSGGHLFQDKGTK